MNKKVSTIFAMAALMGGVFSGSAYAKTLTDFPVGITNGDVTEVSTLSNGAQVALTQNGYLLGFFKNTEGVAEPAAIAATGTEIEDTKVLNYAWQVLVSKSSDNSHNVYTFVNVATKDTLSFDTNGALHITGDLDSNNKKIWAKDDNGRYNFTFGAAHNYAQGQLMNAMGVTTGALEITAAAPFAQLTGTAPIVIGSLTRTTVPDEDLNQLYNGKGFNFAAEKVNGVTAEVEDNLFGEDTPVWAFDVDVTNPDGTEGYIIGTSSNGEKLVIPNGTYFFTNAVYTGGKGASDFMPGAVNPASAANINWLASTLIAVSPTQVSESTDTDRARGAGFKLIEVKGEDFIFKSNTSIPEGQDVSIFNACFNVYTDYTDNSAYPYALEVPTFYYQQKATAAGTDDQSVTSVYIGVSSYDNSYQRVVTKVGTAEHSFMLSSSSVVDGRTLLNDTPTPAIYTIQFVDGTSGDKDLMDKYLTVGANDNGTDFQWEAKGMALANLDYPIFQYVITSATPASDRYINVTFTNRETGQNFTAQLFPVGENRYSLAISNESVTNTGDMTVQAYTVDTQGSNTYDVKKLGSAIDLDSDITVELKKVEDVDNYAGFLNVDNEEIRTLAFARDVNSTSNRLYSDVTVDWRDQDYTNGHAYLSHSWNEYINQVTADYFTDEHSDAAQWQLIKSASPASISRVIVYHNTNTNSVDDVANGDRINAYVYALRYVEDGTATNFFLSNNLPTPASVSTYWNTETYRDLQVLTSEEVETLPNTIRNHNDLNFIIKENVDGSVSLIAEPNAMVTGRTNRSGEETYVTTVGEAKALEMTTDGSTHLYNFGELVYATVPNYTGQYDVKTYLDPQPIEVSWPAKEGHVTIESELGNYITMNEDRDAIVVNEAEADDYYLYVTDKNAVVPSFYITKGVAAANGERMFMFNPTDSVDYYVASTDYDRQYQWAENTTKVMFKAATINDTRDTLTINVKGETKYITKEADDNNADIWGGIKRFKFQIVETSDADGHYYIRQANATDNYRGEVQGNYLSALNEKVTWSTKSHAMIFTVAETSAPTANESVSATEVKVIATDGAVNIKNAAGKNVVISTILGQIVANEVLTSDNATISVPAGIAIVSVDGEEAVKVSVR